MGLQKLRTADVHIYIYNISLTIYRGAARNNYNIKKAAQWDTSVTAAQVVKLPLAAPIGACSLPLSV